MERTIRIQSGESETQAQALMEIPTKASAMKRGFKTLGFTWLGALGTIIIPGVHFITIPAGTVLGPILGFLVYRIRLTRSDIICSSAVCPKCRKTAPLKFASDVKEVERTCKSCGANLKITLIS